MTVDQLPLPFPHEAQYDAADFIAGDSNAAALAWLARTPEWPQLRLALWGPEGCGKTHLLHLWAARRQAPVLRGDALRLIPPATPLAVDDADRAPERMLLHLLNAAAEAGLPILLAARAPPARWPTALPDLASRLRAATAVEIGAPEDSLLRALLARLLVDRHVKVNESVQDWLLKRLPRTQAALREAAARLDRAAYAAARPVNRAIAADVLADLLQEDEDLTQPPDIISSTDPQLL
jgi:chromosomal replication initiation ATPase DnaA